MSDPVYEIGQRLRVTRQIPMGTKVVTTEVEGVVTRFGQEKSGSWFAHTLDKKVWIDRVELRKDDGELSVCNLDRYTAVEILSTPEAA